MKKLQTFTGICLLLLGVLCLAGAGFLCFHNEQENIQVEKMTSEILPELKSAIQEQTDGTSSQTELTYNGDTYLGYLSIPALDLTLPVLQDWNFDHLKIAPCRYSGSLETGNLVIAAHNYKRHFGLLSSLQTGDAIQLTASDGTTYDYEVCEITILQPEDIDKMISGSWDLTLFTCTYGGKSRITIRCSLIQP